MGVGHVADLLGQGWANLGDQRPERPTADDLLEVPHGRRVRQFHDSEHTNAEGELTLCRRHWSNNDRRTIQAERLAKEQEFQIQTRIDAEVDARVRGAVESLQLPGTNARNC